MRITKRQLNKIIKESLGIQINELKSPKQVAQEFKDKKLTRKIGKNLNALKVSTGQRREELEKQLNDQKDELRTAYDAGAFDEMNFKQKAAAKELLSTLETVLEDPKPQAITKAVEQVKDIIQLKVKPQDPKPDKDKWNPDPNPESNWEYLARECIWYARKKGTTKEYKLGHASGTPAMKSGKFINTLIKLNKSFPGLVKNCKPIIVKPKKSKKPKAEPDVTPDVTPGGEEGTNLTLEIIQLLSRCSISYQKLNDVANETAKATGGVNNISSTFGNDHAKILDGSYTISVGSVMDRFSVYKSIGSLEGFTEIIKDYDIVSDLQKVHKLLVGSKNTTGATNAGTIRHCRIMAGLNQRYANYTPLADEFQAIATELKPKLDVLTDFVRANRNKTGGNFIVKESLSRGSLYRNRYGRY